MKEFSTESDKVMSRGEFAAFVEDLFKHIIETVYDMMDHPENWED